MNSGEDQKWVFQIHMEKNNADYSIMVCHVYTGRGHRGMCPTGKMVV